MAQANSVYTYFSSSTFTANSDVVFADDIRLNAEYYLEGTSLRLNPKIKFCPLSKLASVIFPGIFKRYLVEDTKFGIEFLTTSEMMLLEPETDKILSYQLTPNLEIYKVSEPMLLVSRSGTIGNTIYVDNRIKDFALTEDALRVKPLDEKHIGFLYFYFISEYGNNTITGKKSGAVIDHIYEDDLLKLPVPELSESLIKKLFDYYVEVKSKRETAHQLINKARELVLKYNNLLPLSHSDLDTLDPVSTSDIFTASLDDFTLDYRLDAHFYNRHAKLAELNIHKNCKIFKRLQEVTSEIRMSPMFVRNFVENEYGLKYIAGKNISQIRKAFKYISITETNEIDDHILRKGWTLMTCAGTIGKVGYVSDELDGATAQDIMRIIPNENEIDGGYLNSWLSSEYGKVLSVRQKYGAVVDRISPEQTGEILIPIPSVIQQKEIGDLVRQAYDLRTKAVILEDQAQALLNLALTEV